MSREEILERVNRVFKDVFDDEDVAVTFTSTAADVEGWDSLRHITLIEAVEDEFDMRFQMNEVTGMKDVGEMVDIIAERAG
ncbi:MAG: acyl carrier protein [Lachnospiraceae bacterium]|nr:acyl carrier protein [Lachnospiraceae bacterium]